MRKYLYLIKKKKIKSWLKFWLLTKDQVKYVLSEILEGFSFNLQNTVKKRFKIFNIFGNSVQNGTPTPTNPVPIDSVADDVNLFDKDTGIVNGLTYTSNGGTTSLASAFIQETYINVNPNTSYTLSTTNDYSTQDPGEYRLVICEYNASKTFIQRNLGSANVHNKYSIQTTSNTYYVRICASKVTINELKLQKGTTYTPYSPYNQGTVTIKQRGKNKFDINDFVEKASTVLDVTSIGNEIELKRSSTTIFTYSFNFKENTQYTMKLKIKNNNDDYYVFYVYSDNTTETIFPRSIYSEYTEFTKVSAQGKTLSGIRIELYGWNNDMFLKDIQIEEGTQATPYEPYQTNDFTFQTSPLRSLPNGVRDSLEADGIHRRVGRVVLDGTQPLEIVNWRPTETSVGWVYPRSITNNKKQTEGVINNILCNKLKAVSYAYLFGNTVDEGINIVTQSNGYGLVVKTKDTSLTTANAINTYLSSNPITVQYELETEIIEPYTEEQQEQYNKIKELYTFDGTTNIYSTDVVPPYLQIQYYMKGE